MCNVRSKVKICHITTVHVRDDIRIFKKECASLADAGYNVFLIVADGLGNEVKQGVNIVDVLKGIRITSGASVRNVYDPGSRLKRMMINTQLVYRTAVKIDADIYHFHDPELIPVGLKLKREHKTVIYDAHEDVPKAILSKPYLRVPIATVLSRLIGTFELVAVKKYDCAIAATESIGRRLQKRAQNVFVIHNYPNMNEFSNISNVVKSRQDICYVGSITQIRGALQMVQALEYTNLNLIMAGDFISQDFFDCLRGLPGWKNVDYRGLLDRKSIGEIFSVCFAGLILFADEPNHKDALPNKLFEYMAGGLAVVCSGFPKWIEIIEGNRCGICVDQTNPKAIADGLNYLKDNPEIAKQMGENGRDLIRHRYNWDTEKHKLLGLYENLVDDQVEMKGKNGGI